MTTNRPAEQGPFLSAALICEKVLEERDGVKSAVRIIDRVTRTIVGHSPPEEMEPFDYDATLLIKLKSGWARGSYPLRVDLVKPSGESPVPIRHTVYFEGEEDRGVDIVGNMRIRFDQTGIYWFKIYLAEKLLTQIPLRVIYMPQVMQIPRPPGGSPPAQEPQSGR
jgi:hypothetical protein